MEDGSDNDSLLALNGIKPEEPLKEQQKVHGKRKSSDKLTPSNEKPNGEDNHHTKRQKTTANTSETTKSDEKLAQRKGKAERKAAKAAAKRERKKQAANQAGQNKVVEKADGRNVAESSRVTGRKQADIDVKVDGIQIVNDLSAGADEHEHARSTSSPSPTAQSSTFDKSNPHSGSSSISSILPPMNDDAELLMSKPTIPTSQRPPATKADAEELRARLQKRIDALRTARKADGLNGVPARNRQELMDSRRRKEEERKAHRKELRRQAKEEEQRQHAEIIAKGSPLLLGSPLHSPGSPTGSPSTANNFTFGRISFANGQRASSNLSTTIDPAKVRGPSDPRTALQGAQRQESRLAALDPVKRADISQKDAWLHAKQRAEGVKVRDDTNLLKKTLKRKEKQKKKSEREWEERLARVDRAKADRQKKREANLAQRREEKDPKKGGGGGSKSKKNQAARRKPRPGFEGAFRAKAPRAATGTAMAATTTTTPHKPRRR